MQMPDGTEYKVPPALVGGEGRYEDWVYLQMLERGWLRPITDADHFHSIAEGSRPSPRAIVVLVFWAYFETRIKRLIRETTMSLPKTVTKDLGSTPLERTLQRRPILGREECHGKAKEVQRGV